MKLRKISDFTPKFLYGNTVKALVTPTSTTPVRVEFAVIPNRTDRIDLVWTNDLEWYQVHYGNVERVVRACRYGTFTASSFLNALAKASNGQGAEVNFVDGTRYRRRLKFHPKTAATITVEAPCGDKVDVRVASLRRAIEKLT